MPNYSPKVNNKGKKLAVFQPYEYGIDGLVWTK